MPIRKRNNLKIKSFHLEGFKSIEDLKIDLVDGLNIIIGKNGAGKSNFLECIYYSLNSLNRSSAPPYRQAKITLLSEEKHVFELEFKRTIHKSLSVDEVRHNRIQFNKKLFVDRQIAYDNWSERVNFEFTFNDELKSLKGNIVSVLSALGYRIISPLSITFNIPITIDVINVSGVVKIPLSDEDMWEIPPSMHFINELFSSLEYGDFSKTISQKKSLSKSSLLKSLKLKEEILQNLSIYTPIQNVRFNENINIYNDDTAIIIDNLKLEFKINSSWLPWSQLSDGTKRLFYLIAEISNKKNGLILIEEPELGIHPHQFNKVMTFLKEQAETKQIVITTHSPKALDILTESELENILLVSYTKKQGTQINHLSSAQKKKALLYMKEVGFLSDYWLLSNLEND